MTDPKLGSASVSDINYLAQSDHEKCRACQSLLLGNGASSDAVHLQVLFARVIGCMSNYQLLKLSKGQVSCRVTLRKTLLFGRVGLFRNQPGDMLLKKV